MLQLKHICKSYRTGDFVQVALDDVSISFRDNEFVAILGPSGTSWAAWTTTIPAT